MSNHEMPPQAIVDPGLAIVTTGHYYATPGKDQLDAAETMILDAFRGRQ